MRRPWSQFWARCQWWVSDLIALLTKTPQEAHTSLKNSSVFSGQIHIDRSLCSPANMSYWTAIIHTKPASQRDAEIHITLWEVARDLPKWTEGAWTWDSCNLCTEVCTAEKSRACLARRLSYLDITNQSDPLDKVRPIRGYDSMVAQQNKDRK